MIVKDVALTIERAHDISLKMINIYSEETLKFNDDGDPAEQIYLTAHTIASLNAKFAMAMEGYGKIYGIENFTTKIFKEWVSKIEDEIFAQNESLSNDVVKQFKEECMQ